METRVFAQWLKHCIQPKQFKSQQPVSPRIGPSFIKQELAGFSNDQRFVYYEHVVVSVVQLDDARGVLIALRDARQYR